MDEREGRREGEREDRVRASSLRFPSACPNMEASAIAPEPVLKTRR